MKKNTSPRGYTLIELIISVGLFALIMTLAAGAYLIMISINRQTEGITFGIDNLSFALETMTRTIRTSTTYGCPSAGIDCTGGTTFSVVNGAGNTISYTDASGVITQTNVTNNTVAPLTDSNSVTISSLTFYSNGVNSFSATGDTTQARVTIVVSGTVSAGPGKTIPFTIETGATMRGSDL